MNASDSITGTAGRVQISGCGPVTVPPAPAPADGGAGPGSLWQDGSIWRCRCCAGRTGPAWTVTQAASGTPSRRARLRLAPGPSPGLSLRLRRRLRRSRLPLRLPAASEMPCLGIIAASARRARATVWGSDRLELRVPGWPTRPSQSRTRARTGSSALTRSVTSHGSLIPGGPGPPGPTRTARARGGRATLGPARVSESNRGLSGDNKSRLSEPPLLRMLSLRRLADGSARCLPHYKEKVAATWTWTPLAAIWTAEHDDAQEGDWASEAAFEGRLSRPRHARPTTRPRSAGARAPAAEQHGRGGVRVDGAGAAPGRNRFAPFLHRVHMPSELNWSWFALGLDWVYISLCKPRKLCKLLMSKLCKPGFAQVLLFVCTSLLRIYTKFTEYTTFSWEKVVYSNV